MTLVDPARGTGSSATFTIAGVPPTVVVRAVGALDDDALAAFEAAMATAIETGAVSVQIDLTGTTQMEPSFVPALLNARNRVRDLWCAPVSASAHDVLRATGAALVLGVHRYS